MADFRPALFLVIGLALAIGGYVAIVLSCPYGIVATAMTGQVRVPGLPAFLPYRRILSVATVLVLYGFYLWVRARARRNGRQADASLPIALVAVGIAVLGFLAVSYPCPYPVGLWIFWLEVVALGEFDIPYWMVLAVAAGLLLYAVYGWMTRRPAG